MVIEVKPNQIGKATDEQIAWPEVDIEGHEYSRKAVTTHYLKDAPKGETWFVVVPSRWDGEGVEVKVVAEKKAKAKDSE